jgi:hypothetical protein
MSIMGQIGINLEQLAQNIARLQEQAATMPVSADIVQVDGAREEDPQKEFRSKLLQVTQRLAKQTQNVRAYVDRNAAAFERAAANMQDTEGADSLAARQADAFVQAIVSNPSTPSSSAPQPQPQPSTTSRPETGATAW